MRSIPAGPAALFISGLLCIMCAIIASYADPSGSPSSDDEIRPIIQSK